MPSSSISRVEAVTASLRDDILRGQYRAGERLPSERDLAAKFEVNRGVVREAFKKLEQLGIASINPGGVRVVPIEEASLLVLRPLIDLQEQPDPVLIGHMLEVFGALMSLLAQTAVTLANFDEMEQMQAIVGRMVKAPAKPTENQSNWRELGDLFAQINNNLVLRLILNGLKAQFFDAKKERPELPIDPTQTAKIYKQLAASLAARDPQGAAQAINNHFVLIRKALHSFLQQPAPTKDVSA